MPEAALFGAGMGGVVACTGANGCGAGECARSGSFIAAAKAEPKGRLGGADVVACGVGVGLGSGAFAVKRLLMESCGEFEPGADAAANGEEDAADGTAANGEAEADAAKGEATGWIKLKGEFPAEKPGCG